MTPQLFIDAGAWIAMEVENDRHHHAALAFLKSQGYMYDWITTNWVFSESVTWLRRRAGHHAAVSFGERVQASRQLSILRVQDVHERRAWEIFRRYSDKDFGFVDCTSFAVMEDMGIVNAFAFDRHFRQFGFNTLPVVSE